MAQIDHIVDIVRDVLSTSMTAAYLHGSAVLGGLRKTSDIDVLAVVDRRTRKAERREIVTRLMAISDPSRAQHKRPVEVTIVRQADVRPWRYPPLMEFQYGEWLRADYARGVVPEAGANADLAPLLAVVLLGDHPLVGPPPAELLAPVPVADLRRAIVEGMAEWVGRDKIETDTRNMLLALSRIWHTLATGEIVRKDVAARWAAERLDPVASEMVSRARTQYLRGTHGERAWPVMMDRVRASVATLVAQIHQAE
jgi:predicted nucleotidyltransferase